MWQEPFLRSSRVTELPPEHGVFQKKKKKKQSIARVRESVTGTEAGRQQGEGECS